MKVYKNLPALRTVNFRSVITIGVFDGLHLGHQKIIKELIKISKRYKAKNVIITFEPHPQSISSKRPPRFINSFSQRLDLMKQLGVDVCLVVKFTRKFALTPAEYFIKSVLLDRLNMVSLVVSSDYRFGKNKEGNIELLQSLSKEYDFKLKQIDTVRINKKAVRSTLIRNLLNKGNLYLANRMLNRPYFISGIIIKGSGVGSKIGYPTINLKPEQDVILPTGVYIAFVEVNNKKVHSIVNIGFKPTVTRKENRKRTIEAHILNFSHKLYGRKIRIFFLKRIRDEKKFKKINDLQKAIKRDIKISKAYFKHF